MPPKKVPVCHAPSLKRPAAPKESVLHDVELHQELTQCGNDAQLAKVLGTLSERGWLKGEVVAGKTRSIQRKLDGASKIHGNMKTPYGTVVQQMDLPVRSLPKWKFAHPMALLFYLCLLSAPFADVMEHTSPGQPLRIVIYIDEICPGNPLRPEKSRTLQSVYWCCADWPDWLLQRTAAWPVFGTIRSSVVEQLDGGVSHLMKLIMHTFWPENGDSMANGFTIVKAGGERIIRNGLFCGFLCDEKAHNQVTGSKGASGTKPCLTCRNCYGRTKGRALPAGCVTIACCGRHSSFVFSGLTA